MVAETTIAFVFAVVGLVSTVLWLGLAGVGVLKLDQLRRALGDDEDADAEADPMETLRERYAEGELTDEEFERKTERLIETESSAERVVEPE